MEPKKTWLWRAWTAGRERIADCGTARAATRDVAQQVAWMCLGGPHAPLVEEMQVEEIE